MKRSLALLGMVAVAAFGCGDNGDDTTSGQAGGGGSSTSGTASGGGSAAGGSGQGGEGGSSSGEWETLIDGEWSLEPGTEDYVCVVLTVPEEVFISAFEPIAPLGTHHTVLSKGASGADGSFPCGANTNGPDMVYGSGVGTTQLSMPPGVAVKLEAGTKLILNLHLFNATGDVLNGLSGVRIKRIEPAEVQAESASVLAGTIGINIPPQGTKTETGYCTTNVDTNIFAVGPHMHQFGTHMTVTAEQADGDVVLLDKPYTFDDQLHYKLDNELVLKAGERVKVECTYSNPTAEPIGFGDSSLQEMCFAGLFSYPPINGQGVVCVN